MKFLKSSSVFFAIFCAVFMLCTSRTPLFAQNPDAPVNTAMQQLVSANTEFAVNLYAKYASLKENIFFSPYSISSALGMTYEGAQGETAKEMEKVFGFIQEAQKRREGTLSLFSEINKKDKQYELSTANALWVQAGYKLLDSYTDIVNKFYGSNITPLDFVNKAEESRLTINSWVEKQTHEKIKNIIPPPLPSGVSLILTNAIYFLGNWEKQFDITATSDQKFWITPATSVKAPMMTFAQNPVYRGYTETETYQALNLPYKSEDLSMMIILPKSRDIKKLEAILSDSVISDCQQKTKNRMNVVVSIPKFKIETTYSLTEPLAGLGMKTAFQYPAADFSGIDGTHNLFISKIIHKAFVEVNETGTEAAAATAIMVEAGASPGPRPVIPVFVADHPFLFVIQQQATGNILFMGRVLDPTRSL